MSAADLLLVLPFAGLLVDGFRSPWAWAAGGAALWGALLGARGRLSGAPLRPWLPWLAWAALSAAWSGQPAMSLPALARWAGVIFFWAAAVQLWDDRHRRHWLLGLLGAAAVLGVAGLVTGAAPVLRGQPGNAMTGLLPPYYNYTAFVEAAAFAAAATLLARGERLGGRRWPLWALLLFTGGWLVFARSRGGVLAALAGVALPALTRRGRAKALLPAAGALAAAVAAVTVFVVARGVGGPAFVLKPELARAFKRPQLWTASVRAAEDHPLLGDGLGQYEKGFRRHVFPAAGYGPVRFWFTSDHAHSEPLELAVETGFVGLALFLGAFALTAAGPWAGDAAGEAALAAAAAMAVHCLGDNMLQIPSLALLLFGALACCRRRRTLAPERWAGGAWAGAAAAGLALTLLAPLPGALAGRWSSEAGPPGPRLERAQKLVALYPREPAAREALARALMAQQPPQLAQASAQLEEASRLAPDNAFYLVWRAELLRAAGRWDEVQVLAQRAVDLEPNFLQARLLLAEVQARSGQTAQARRELDDLAARRDALAAQGGGSPYGRIVLSFDARRFDALSRLVGRR